MLIRVLVVTGALAKGCAELESATASRATKSDKFGTRTFRTFVVLILLAVLAASEKLKGIDQFANLNEVIERRRPRLPRVSRTYSVRDHCVLTLVCRGHWRTSLGHSTDYRRIWGRRLRRRLCSFHRRWCLVWLPLQFPKTKIQRTPLAPRPHRCPMLLMYM